MPPRALIFLQMRATLPLERRHLHVVRTDKVDAFVSSCMALEREKRLD
jgi:hypothetical protein